MNIFITDNSPHLSAEALDDKRVNKMLLESCQMLSTAINFYGGKAPYKSTHANHPSNIWARKTKANFNWLFSHATALSNQYLLRSTKVHACASILQEISISEQYKLIPDGPLTPFANCAANDSKGVNYKHINDVTKAYKLYLIDRWNTDTRKPTWFSGTENIPKWVCINNNGTFFYKDKEYNTLFGGENENSKLVGGTGDFNSNSI